MISSEYIPLTERPVPPVVAAQIGNFTLRSIHAEKFGSIDIALPENKLVIASDVGGDSLTNALMTVEQGKLVTVKNLANLKGIKDGAGYAEQLEVAARYGQVHGIPMGVSYAGQMEGTRPIDGPNVPILFNILKELYGGDFANQIPTLAAAENDAVSGLRASANHLKDEPDIDNIIYVINGSGLNTAVLKNGVAYVMESGHVEVVDELNSYHQDTPCGNFGGHVCVERVAAGKAGVEDIWQRETGIKLSGPEIEAQALGGDRLAAQLYDNSAILTAHVVLGVAKALNIDLSEGRTAVVGHGGTFKYPQFGERVQQAVGKYTGVEPPIYLTHKFSANACLDGAALAALANSR